MQRIIETPKDLRMLVTFLEKRPMPMTVEITGGKHRTSKQNKLQFKWLKEISEQMGDDIEYWRGYCKLHFAVPILREDDEKFREKYDEKVRPYPYETKLEFMVEPWDFPCTRLMNTSQKTKYLDAIYQHFTTQGVKLTDPIMAGRE